MGWKNWSYWLKGGIISGIFGLIVGLLALFLRDIFNNSFLQVLNLPSFAISFALCYENLVCSNIIYVISSFIVLFLLGALIGYTYGKIKNRKSGVEK